MFDQQLTILRCLVRRAPEGPAASEPVASRDLAHKAAFFFTAALIRVQPGLRSGTVLPRRTLYSTMIRKLAAEHAQFDTDYGLES